MTHKAFTGVTFNDLAMVHPESGFQGHRSFRRPPVSFLFSDVLIFVLLFCSGDQF